MDKLSVDNLLEKLGADLKSGETSLPEENLDEALTCLDSPGPRFTKKESILLYLILRNRNPMYGLDLVKQSEGSVPKGSVYVFLGRLVEKGILVVTSVTPPKPGKKGPDRVMYGFAEGYDKIFYVWYQLAEIMNEV